MSNLHTFCAWAAHMRSWCEHDRGPDSMSLTVDDVTLHVTARKATIVTPAGKGELDVDKARWVTTPEAPALLAAPSSSKQKPQDHA